MTIDETQPISAHEQGEHGSTDLRTRSHAMWSSVAPSWDEHADFVDVRSPEIADQMLALAALRPGNRVLELACGPGGVGLAAAPLVTPGEVVCSDIAAPMTAIAARRAKARGLTNVSTARLDLDSIEQPDRSFDVVLCREGLQFATEPEEALREIRRILRPGGRVSLAVWGPRDENPWLGLVLDAVSAQLGRPVPPPGIPGPFALDDAGRLSALMTAAGLSEVTVTELSAVMNAGPFDAWWRRTVALAGPLANAIRSLDAQGARQLERRAQTAVAPYNTPTGLVFPSVALLAAASVPTAG